MESRDELGIGLEGEVLRRGLSVAERRDREAVDLMDQRRTEAEERYDEVEEYDPVLRWHCGLEGKPRVLRP